MKFPVSMRKSITPNLFLLPAIILMFSIMIVPLVQAIRMSFLDKRLLVPGEDRFVFLENYLSLLQSQHFLASAQNTLFYILFSVLGGFAIGLAAALLLNQRFPGRAVMRTIVLLPFVTPVVVVAISWRWMFNDVYGVFNDLFIRIGLIDGGINWLGDTSTALAAIIVSNVWRMFPFHCIFILAALQTVPMSLYEAAQLDGATAVQKFVYITAPLILPACILSVIITSLLALNDFPMVWIMTQGGPGHATEVFSTFVFKEGLRFYNLGSASAAGVIALIIMGTIAYLLVRLVHATSRRAGQSL